MTQAPRLGYVVRFVEDLEPAVSFYAGVLGLTCSKRTRHWAQLDCGGVRLGLYQREAMARALGVDAADLGVAPGALEIAFEVDDVDAAFAAALTAGARPFREPADRSWGERTAYLLDPEGALVELYARPDRAADAEAASHRAPDNGSPADGGA